MNNPQNPPDSLHNAMLFLYKTRKCPLLKKSSGGCPNAANCFDYHENDLRRRPYMGYHSQWNYSNNKCTTGYPNMPHNCSHGKNCTNYHTSDELRYHPMEYKHRPCADPQFKSTGMCSRGPRCWQYHREDDKRTRHSFTPRSINDTALNRGSRPPQQYLDWVRNSQLAQNQQSQIQTQPQIQPQPQPQPHSPSHSQPPPHIADNNNNNNEPKEYKESKQDDIDKAAAEVGIEHARWFSIFKRQRCMKGKECRPGINCMDWHDESDRRRPFESNKIGEACGNVWDFDDWGFVENKKCPNGDDCQYAHNLYELWYHQNTYKSMECPYLKLTKAAPDFYKVEECPFARDISWFNEMFRDNPVVKNKDNRLKHADKSHTCLDYCCFYHNEKERRFANAQKPKAEDNTSQKAFNNNNNNAQNNSNILPHMQQNNNSNYNNNNNKDPPHYGQQNRDPPHYGRKQNENNNNQNSNESKIYNAAPQNPMHGNNGRANNYNYNPEMNKTDLEQKQSEITEFPNDDNDGWN